MLLTGVALAACAALTHTAIDSTRKYAASVMGIPSEGLVTVPAILDMVISFAGVWWSGRWRGPFRHLGLFASATVTSSLLLLVSRYMYQRAIQLSPLSLTIPYLAFTPAILIATAYIFLGELPSSSGLVGVLVVTLGGYLLNLKAGSASPAGSSGANGAATNGTHHSITSSKPTDASPTGPMGPTALPVIPAVVAVAATGALMQRSSSSTTVSDVESGGLSGSAGGPSMTPLKRAAKAGLHRRVSSAVATVMRSPSVLGWQQEPGTLLMIGVAVIWSVTASLDKLGVLTAPTIWAYFVAQRFVIGMTSLSYILARSPRLLLLLRDHFWVMLVISALELAAVVLFLLAVRHLLVSYVVAIKRCNVLFSVVLGALIFRESVGSRLPYVFLMMLGMTVIVLEPGAHSFVHSHIK